MWIKLLGLFLVIVVIIGSIAETKQRRVKRTLHWKYQIDYTLHVRGLEKLKENNFMKSIPAYPDQQAYTAKEKEF